MSIFPLSLGICRYLSLISPAAVVVSLVVGITSASV